MKGLDQHTTVSGFDIDVAQGSKIHATARIKDV